MHFLEGGKKAAAVLGAQDRKPECSKLALVLLWQHLKLDPTPVLTCMLQGIAGVAAAYSN